VIVSHTNRFIFFHNPKCAGTSFRDTLKPYHDDAFTFWGIFYAPYFKNHIDHTHLRLWEMQVQFPKIFACAELQLGDFRAQSLCSFSLGCERAHQEFQPHIKLESMSPEQRVWVVEAFVRQGLTIARITTDWRFIHFSPQLWYLRLGDRRTPAMSSLWAAMMLSRARRSRFSGYRTCLCLGTIPHPST
jgi:hypothetical protein